MDERKKDIPRLIKGIGILTVVICVVIGVTFGLRLLERKQQKPRVIKAFINLATDITDDKFSLDACKTLLKEGKTKYEGSVNLRYIDKALLDGWISSYSFYLQGSTIYFGVERDEITKQMTGNASLQIAGRQIASLDSYMNENKCIFRIPELHNSFLRIETQNIRTQYENSLLYIMLKNAVPLPEKEFSINAFPEKRMSDTMETSSQVIDYLLDNQDRAIDFYQSIVISRLQEKEEILWDGEYVTCTQYLAEIPTEYIKPFLPEKIEWKDDILFLTLSLGPQNRILKMSGDFNLQIEENILKVSASCYPKGVENAFDQMAVDFVISDENQSAGFTLASSNEYSNNEHLVHLNLQMTQPYVMKIMDMDFTTNIVSGESSIDFNLQIPQLAMDGKLTLQKLQNEIQMPQEKFIDIFKLNLLDVAKFVNGLNIKLFDQ